MNADILHPSALLDGCQKSKQHCHNNSQVYYLGVTPTNGAIKWKLCSVCECSQFCKTVAGKCQF